MPSNPYFVLRSDTPGTAGDFVVDMGSKLAYYFARRLTGRGLLAPTGKNLGRAFGVKGHLSDKD